MKVRRSGLMARGGFEVIIDWENGKPRTAEIISSLGNSLKSSCMGKVMEIKNTSQGEVFHFDQNLNRLN
jgi:alpha-L-fucosidase 2